MEVPNFATYRRNIILLEAVNNTAVAFYQNSLYNTEGGRAARAWLRKRGISQESQDRWEIGYAPSTRNWLLKEMGSCFAPELLRESALFLVDDDVALRDRFRRRLILPIRNEYGAVVSLAGRVLDDSAPKYMGMPNTPLFEKQHALYGLHLAVPEIIANGKVYIVEGQFDAITMHQYGFRNTIALMGTTLLPTHIQLLRLWCGGVVFIADGDEAGMRALNRAADMRLQEDLKVKLSLLRVPPTHGDPDQCVRTMGAKAFADALSRWEEIGG